MAAAVQRRVFIHTRLQALWDKFNLHLKNGQRESAVRGDSAMAAG